MSHSFYLDASALGKRYAPETGSSLVNHLFHQAPRNRLLCLLLGTVEVISLFVRKQNAQVITPAAFLQALTDLRKEVIDAADFRKVTASDALVNAAIPLVERHSINATDAVILHSALEIAAILRAGGDDLVLVSSDQRLLRAAQAEGLATFNPETQTPIELDAILAP